MREDLKTYNRRLLDYARNGGNLIVLYNTQEFVPNQYAPFPGELPRRPKKSRRKIRRSRFLRRRILSSTRPNKITQNDFDNWVEQRGSKFWSTWDPPTHR